MNENFEPKKCTNAPNGVCTNPNCFLHCVVAGQEDGFKREKPATTNKTEQIPKGKEETKQ